VLVVVPPLGAAAVLGGVEGLRFDLAEMLVTGKPQYRTKIATR